MTATKHAVKAVHPELLFAIPGQLKNSPNVNGLVILVPIQIPGAVAQEFINTNTQARPTAEKAATPAVLNQAIICIAPVALVFPTEMAAIRYMSATILKPLPVTRLMTA